MVSGIIIGETRPALLKVEELSSNSTSIWVKGRQKIPLRGVEGNRGIENLASGPVERWEVCGVKES